MSQISDKILQILLEKEISYGELAERTGISKSALQRYATGETEKIPIDRLEKIAAAIGTSSIVLMGWEKENTPVAPEYDEGTRRLIDAIVAMSHEDKKALARLLGVDYE